MEYMKLQDCCKIIAGQSPESKYYNTERIGLPFFQGKADFGDLYPQIRVFCSQPTKVAEKDDILLSVRAPVGPTNLAPCQVCIGRGLTAIRPSDKLLIRYVLLFFRYYEAQLESKGTGTTFKAITQDVVKNLLIPVPSIDQQKCIVEKTEELLSQLDAGVETLNKVRAQLIRYRRSVVHHELKKDYYGIEWKETTFGEICDCLDSRRKPVNKKTREQAEGKYPYYGANGETGRIDDYLFDEELVLVCEDETFVGRIKPFSYIITGKSWVNNHAHILRGKAGILRNKYLHYLLSYYPFLSIVTGTTGRKKLTQEALLKAPIRICDYSSQNKVIEAIESRLSVCDSIEQSVDQILQQTEAMKQSILKQAFEGGL